MTHRSVGVVDSAPFPTKRKLIPKYMDLNLVLKYNNLSYLGALVGALYALGVKNTVKVNR